MPITREEKFDNIHKWLDAVQLPSTMATEIRASRNKYSTFNQTNSFEHALELATKGWPEGSLKVEKYLMELTPFLRTVKGYRNAWMPGMLPQGGLILDNYVKGLPDCMLNRARKPSNKFARVVFNASILNDINANEYFGRGALIIALVDTLERNNYRIQICAQNCTVGYNSDKLVTEVILKNYGESLDGDRIAFWASHVAVNRRISFSYRETLDSYWLNALST